MSKLLAMMMKRKMPSRYQEVEYIESTGTQYIKIQNNIVFDINLACDIDFQYTSANLSNTIFSTGYYGNTPEQCKNQMKIEYYSSPYLLQMLYYNGNADNAQIIIGLSWNQRYKMTLNGKNHQWFYNDILVGSTTFSILSGTDTAMLFFNYSDNYCKAKLYNIKLYNGDTNKIYFWGIPVFNTITNKYGLYDKVSKTFFGNQGSGDFSGGND